MSNDLSAFKFAASHEWLVDNGDGTVTVGISDHAQELLGDVVYVQLPELDAEVEAGADFSLVESVKAASEVYSPVSGVVVEVNESLDDAPETINESPYGDGWIARIRLSDASELDKLMNAEEYAANLD